MWIPGRKNLNLRRSKVGALQAKLLQPQETKANVVSRYRKECVSSKVGALKLSVVAHSKQQSLHLGTRYSIGSSRSIYQVKRTRYVPVHLL